MNQKKVAVGMSGGLDSSIVALLLKNQGHEVVGLTMKFWNNNCKVKGSHSGCYGPGENKRIEGVKLIAEKLDIPLNIIDLSQEYERDVIDYFKREYENGRTPNPCIMCNSKVKFGALIDKTRESGIDFDYFATGHYARISKEDDELYLLKKGIDDTKDQSYFLYKLTQQRLSQIMFPLGEMKKKDVRVIARDLGLHDLAEKKESQNFIQSEEYSSLIDNKVPGNIVSLDGEIIGNHTGIASYTVGQRKINIGGLSQPYYVIKIDKENNEIVAGPKERAYSQHLEAEDMNWIVPLGKVNEKVEAKIRYGSTQARAIIKEKTQEKIILEFESPQFAITPGQAVVLYDDDIVIGGGIITKTF